VVVEDKNALVADFAMRTTRRPVNAASYTKLQVLNFCPQNH
jgi:hypothetical protein